MRNICAGVFLLMLGALPCQAGFFDTFSDGLGLSMPKSGLDDATIAKGLKEALATGTDRAVKAVGKPDGFLGNQAIRILLPEKIRTVADLVGKLGYQQQVDDFVTSMNRAAEKAAPKAADYFVAAIKEMSLEDAQGILQGGDTAATEYFQRKTRDKLHQAFKPEITASMEQVGVTRSYQEMIAKYQTIPLMKSPSLDLNSYVTEKSLDGLFHMIGEEEKNIRTNPAARATELLRKVFAR